MIYDRTWTTPRLPDDIGVRVAVPCAAADVTDIIYLVGHRSDEWFDNTDIATMTKNTTIVLIAIDDLGSWGGVNRPAEGFFYEDFISQDVLPKSSSTLGIDVEHIHRHIAGFSKGSYLAMRMGCMFPNLFGHVISCSGGSADGYGLFYDMEKVMPGLVARMFPGITSARQFDLSKFNMENLIRGMAENHERFPAIDMYCGNEDTVARSSNVRLDGILTELDIPHTFTMLEGTHSWKTAEKAMHQAITSIMEGDNER